jgi:hypothetical protein
MRRVATFYWEAAAPTPINEQLALYDDGWARLVVRSPLDGKPTIGTYAYRPPKADFDALAKAGANDVSFDALGPVSDEMQQLQELARRVALEATDNPEATATFYGPPIAPSEGGEVSLALQVVGAGKRAVQFDIDPLECAVLFSNFDEPVGWREFPDLATGFVTPDAEGLGGLSRRAEVKPKAYGALVVKTLLPTPVTGVAIQVAGHLYEALPDEKGGAPFSIRTGVVDL